MDCIDGSDENDCRKLRDRLMIKWTAFLDQMKKIVVSQEMGCTDECDEQKLLQVKGQTDDQMDWIDRSDEKGC